MNVIIYEPEISGHHKEYLQHIFNHFDMVSGNGTRIHFIVHPKFDAEKEVPGHLRINKSLFIHNLSEEETYWKNQSNNHIVRSEREWSILEKFCKKLNVTKVFINSINIFQYALGTGKAISSGIEISGILFMPYYRIDTTGTLYQKLNGSLERIKKYVKLKWMLRNPNIKNVFILNDEKATQALNKAFRSGNKFKVLPDPVFIYEDKQHTFELRKKYGIPPENKIALLFGALRAGKGVGETLRFFETDDNLPVTLLVIGKAYKNIENSMLSRIQAMQLKGKSVVVDNRYVESHEIYSIFKGSDMVMLLYTQPEGSSGVLGHAAYHNKFIISTGKGLLGDMVNKYGLGQTVDINNTKEVMGAVKKAMKEEKRINRSIDYCSVNSPEKFARTVTGVITN